MAKIQLLFLCGFFITAAQAGFFGTMFSALTNGLFNLFLSANVKRPVHVRTVEELNNSSRGEFVVLDFVGLVEQHEGYTAEQHKVETDDGYILGLHRITGSPKSPKADDKPVVYIGHGLTGSSDFMVDLGPERSLALQLADAGYDVWLGNLRGSTHSRAHVKYSTEDKEFWNFSMDESALFDTSKFIDVALEKTGQETLTYIGYSMGTALSYMLLADKPEYNEKINLLINLAPAVVFLPPINWRIELYYLRPLLLHARTIKKEEVLAQSGEVAAFGKDSCASENSNYCKSFLSSVANVEKLNATNIPTILTYSPAGTSCNTLEHYAQLINAKGVVRKFNSDASREEPPAEYDLSKVTVPNVLLYAKNDFFVKVAEAEHLKSLLSNVTIFEAIADDTFNHLDFMWSSDAKPLVFDRVIDIMSNLL